jgi:hypothetical protein
MAPIISAFRRYLRCVDFELILLGTKYGQNAGNQPGDLIFTTSGHINVSVETFYTKTMSDFNVATIVKSPPSLVGRHAISVNNISLGFDLSKIGFIPNRVQFEFVDQGGIENLSINGSKPYIGHLVKAPSSINGINVTVYTKSVPPGAGKAGMVVLRGAVKEIKVGGQELFLDQVCASRTVFPINLREIGKIP